MESLCISGSTDPGRRRSTNQDACIIRHLRDNDKALAVVIDGVGGYAGGERAAAIAKDCIEQYMQTPSGDTLTMLREALIFANNQVAVARKKDQRYSEMCCVLTALVADTIAQQIYFVHVGDTRLYRYRNGQLQKLTRDHSFVGIREDAGEISEEEAMTHPHRNQILREVGSAPHRLDDADFMDYGSDILVPGDLLLLCSDGLTDMINAGQLISILQGRQPLANKTVQLIELANAAGGHDNITVVLLEYPTENSTAKQPAAAEAPIKKPAAAAQPATTHKKSVWGKTSLLFVLLLLTGVAGAGWYLTAPKKVLLPAVNQFISAQPVDSVRLDSSQLKPTGRASHAVVPGPMLPVKADTLRISSTQNFADIKKHTDSSGKLLVLVPAKQQHHHYSAIAITGRSARPGDTVLLSNLHITGFDNGIEIQLPIVLTTVNLVFEHTTHPFSFLLKPGEQKASILFINTPKQ